MRLHVQAAEEAAHSWVSVLPSEDTGKLLRAGTGNAAASLLVVKTAEQQASCRGDFTPELYPTVPQEHKPAVA